MKVNEILKLVFKETSKGSLLPTCLVVSENSKNYTKTFGLKFQVSWSADLKVMKFTKNKRHKSGNTVRFILH